MEIVCSRCGAKAAPMVKEPMPTALGREVQARVCEACWREWLRAQVMLINEYRLNMVDPAARAALEGQMREFLNLPAESGS